MIRAIVGTAVVSVVLVSAGCSNLPGGMFGGKDRSSSRSSSGDYRTSPPPSTMGGSTTTPSTTIPGTSPTTSQDRQEQRDRLERMERERAIGVRPSTPR